MPDFDYDLLTIGGGSGGVRAARFAANLGARVALAEGAFLGGTCVNVGCIPKKLMSMAAHYHDDFEDAVGFGWERAQPRFDWAQLMAQKDREIARLNGVYGAVLRKAGVDILSGWARLVDPHTVQVGDKTYSARHILLATGGSPTKAKLAGSEHAITSDGFFHLKEQPRRALVYGGGYIAVELASILQGLGTEVTLVYRGSRLVREFDADLGTHLVQEMRKRGMPITMETVVCNIAKHGNALAVELQGKLGEAQSLECDCVLFATGRSPRVAGTGFDTLGGSLAANGAVLVDEQFRSSIPSIRAIGDVIDRIALTPVATCEGMAVAEILFGKAGRKVNYPLVPTAVFSHPNIASVGLSQSAAIEQVGEVRVFKSRFTPLRHTLSGRDEKALMKLVVDARTDQVLGVHMVGPDAGEIIQGFAVALTCGATKAQFDATIGIHPTLAEEFVTLREPS